MSISFFCSKFSTAMPKEFEYLVECKNHSGKVLQKEFFVIAKDKQEADEELRICVGYHRGIQECRLVRLVEVTDIPEESPAAKQYRERGPYAVYEPDIDFWKSVWEKPEDGV